ncbi:helix-turn-helix domain-containing protein [Bifidobacterium sp. B4107]|uniref:helix-turn-helix domain-containing protein n=1 Tax=unclassified Bifidobacterium TaxID=2608897 RepID=UPI00226B0AB9|nr:MULTISPECIES: helix-turn-helix domain-containing protein [unclassified Bifidobacterium]MCX8648425.1 helix-turn-helix domain-containing protein [Bifidobacterium sp. B4107]MCX8652583.1 helix-turn-helix domain-containing protein [Bifidobacterium sp. B4111]MCX8659053.1 helix-turn-helix domain-containing protein [Bifidobacterium sp. B4114]
MSWQATSWALRKAPVGGNTTARLILVSLADRAGVDGRNTWPSVRTLTDELHISDSTVRRQLTWLEERGIISRGNQSMAARNAHGKVIPPQFRPVVWNLSMGVPAEQVEETEESLLEVRPVKMTGQKTVAEARPVTHADSDLSPVTDKPVILKPSPSPSDEGPPGRARRRTRIGTPPV